MRRSGGQVGASWPTPESGQYIATRAAIYWPILHMRHRQDWILVVDLVEARAYARLVLTSDKGELYRARTAWRVYSHKHKALGCWKLNTAMRMTTTTTTKSGIRPTLSYGRQVALIGGRKLLTYRGAKRKFNWNNKGNA